MSSRGEHQKHEIRDIIGNRNLGGRTADTFAAHSSAHDAINTHLILSEDGERFFDLLIGETQEGIFRVERRDLRFIGRCFRLFIVAHDDLRRRLLRANGCIGLFLKVGKCTTYQKGEEELMCFTSRRYVECTT